MNCINLLSRELTQRFDVLETKINSVQEKQLEPSTIKKTINNTAVIKNLSIMDYLEDSFQTDKEGDGEEENEDYISIDQYFLMKKQKINDK